jgi:REP-associated tyrosine transposase
MAQTYSSLLLHIVFSTKSREPVLDEELKDRLYKYLGGAVRSERGTVLEIGGTADHIHMLVRWRTDESIATLMRNVKSHSSKWIHQTRATMKEFAWQRGYGVFTVSRSQRDKAAEYIRRQEEHHQSKTFKEEFVEFLEAHDIEYDARYLWE